ncbi:MAG: hypothetical protein PUB08_06910 [Firmicutes bacterium]|nr:hypothetical protein [Bacillota bacterium]
MPLKTIEINSIKLEFDKEKTKEYRTIFNMPCDCQNCRNYYEHVKNNFELVEYLSGFGIDFNCTEEVFSWNWGDDNDSLIHHEGYYGVFGRIEGEEFDFEKFGVKISFQKCASVPCDRTGEYFWICIEGDFPYILDEKRDLPISFSPKKERLNFVNKINTVFKK